MTDKEDKPQKELIKKNKKKVATSETKNNKLGGRPKGSVKNAVYVPHMKVIMLDLSRCGKSLTQIAVALSEQYNMPIIAETLISWEKTIGETYAKHLKLCRTYAQAFHEDLLESMISQKVKASSSEIEGQKWKLKTLFSDWGDKAQKIELSQTDSMGDKELEAKVAALLKRTGNLPKPADKPTLKVVGISDDK